MLCRNEYKLLMGLIISIIGFGCSDAAKQSATPPPPNYLKVTNYYPDENALSVPLNSNIFVSLDRGVKEDTVATSIKISKDGNELQNNGLTIRNNSITIDPANDLEPNSTYTVEIFGILGLDDMGMEQAKSWTFITGDAVDQIAPTINGASPGFESTTDEVIIKQRYVSIQLNFSEPVDANSLDPSVFQVQYGNTIIPTNISQFSDGLSGGSGLINSINITFSPVGVLPNNVDVPFGGIIDITVLSPGFKDREGNTYSSANQNPPLRFQVELDTDADLMPDLWEEKYTGVSNGAGSLEAGADIETDGATPPVATPDGLSNLQEYQLGTNPIAVDSDSDGVNDGDEVTQGRNPAVNEPAIVSIIDNLLLN